MTATTASVLWPLLLFPLLFDGKPNLPNFGRSPILVFSEQIREHVRHGLELSLLSKAKEESIYSDPILRLDHNRYYSHANQTLGGTVATTGGSGAFGPTRIVLPSESRFKGCSRQVTALTSRHSTFHAVGPKLHVVGLDWSLFYSS